MNEKIKMGGIVLIGLYERGVEEADRRNEMDRWLASTLHNTACALELQEMCENGQPDLYSEHGKALLEEYGIDRVMWILAFQIHQHPGDYSMQTWAWSDGIVPKEFPMKEAETWSFHAPEKDISHMAEQVQHMYARLGLLDFRQCSKNLREQDVSGKLLIISPKSLHDHFKKPFHQYFYATESQENSDMVSGYFLTDGQRHQFKRERIIGVADEAMLPQWAQQRLAQIRAPQMQIRIFQIDHDQDTKRLAYRSLDRAMKSGGVDPSLYRQVYGGTVSCSNLEEVFQLCNMDEKPHGYYGESLSVSNVVEVCEGEQKGFYYCDKTGFQPIDFDISQTDHAEQLRILIVEPGKEPYTAEIRDCLKAMQSAVGGLIDPVYFDQKGEVFAYCNDEALLYNEPVNRRVGDHMIYGTFMIAGDQWTEDGHDTISLTEEQIAVWSEQFRYPLITLSQQEAQMYHLIQDEQPEDIAPVQS